MQFINKYLYLILLTTWVWACAPADPSEDTEFLKAIRQGKTEQVNQLLSQNPDLLKQKTEAKGLTALHVAAQKSNVETITLLLEKGAKINETSADGSTALHYALSNTFAVVRTLLEAGIDPAIQNKDGLTAWDRIEKKSKGTWFAKKENELLGLILKYDYLPDTTQVKDQAPLLHRMAGKAKNPDIVRLLIEKYKLNPTATDEYGWTPLHYAAKGQHKDAAQILVDNGADINAQSTENREEIRGDADAEIRYKYPIGVTPKDVYSKRGVRNNRENLNRFFEQYGGKKSEELK